MTTARRWNSFVCPGCRSVFRVPQEHDGKGVVCPACRIMLRLPEAGDELPPLVRPPREAMPDPANEEEFEEEAVEEVAAVHSDRNFIVGLVLSALTLLSLFWWWMMPDAAKSGNGTTSPPDAGVASASGNKAQHEPTTKTLISEIESVVKAFLEAPTAEEALRWVRDPAAIAPKIAGKPYAAPGFKGLVDDAVTNAGLDARIMSVAVRTGDFEMRKIALLKEGGQLKVDWESWAGWSEMPWADFKREKPVEPKLFRVVLSRIDYYNFAFKDESEWSSYRLDSPDGSDSLYGYVRRTSELDQQIRPVDNRGKINLLLRLEFPPDSLSDNQVLIDSLAGDGWVETKAADR